MPKKLSTDDEAALREVLRMQGFSEKGAEKIMRQALIGSKEAKTASTTEGMHQDLLERLREQKKKGIKFSRADILEFLGQDEDELPPGFEELLK